MVLRRNEKHAVPPMEVSVEAGNAGGTEWLDDDEGRPRRTGTVWTASSYITIVVTGSGVLFLAWAIARLGWFAGPAALLVLAFVTYYAATLLAEYYRSGDPATGKRNYTYMDAVRSNLAGVIQYANLVGVAIGYTIVSWISIGTAVRRAGCYHGQDPCWSCVLVTAVIGTGVLSLFLAWAIARLGWVAVHAAMPMLAVVTYYTAILIWHSLQAFGDIVFGYSYFDIPFGYSYFEIQDTIQAPSPWKVKAMKAAEVMKKAATPIFYILCGCLGYAVFGNDVPFGLLYFAKIVIVVHLLDAYQVFCRPIFAFVERLPSLPPADLRHRRAPRQRRATVSRSGRRSCA